MNHTIPQVEYALGKIGIYSQPGNIVEALDHFACRNADKVPCPEPTQGRPARIFEHENPVFLGQTRLNHNFYTGG